YMTRSSGPQIRGGEAAAMVRIAADPLESHDDRCDLLLAIDWLNVDRFADEIPLDTKSITIGDPDGGELPEAIRTMGARSSELSLKKMAKEIPGGRPNMIALGAVAEIIGLPEQVVLEVIGKTLKKKGEAALTASIAGIKAGRKAASALPHLEKLVQPENYGLERWSITGNEATGLGAVRGGVRFVAAYPITPGTEVLEWLAPALSKVGGVLVQAEDELASITQLLGASFGGTPALTATSGPGLALMMESIGLAVASETPLVIVDVMRGGPSTGIPTKSEQSDLNIALFGLHGDAPHLVLAPTSVSDCLMTSQWAVHLAESLQAVAIVLSDQSLGQTRSVIKRPADLAFIAKRDKPTVIEDGYQRYAVTSSGVSPMAIPGIAGGQYTADGLTHTPQGIPSSSAGHHLEQLDKRRRKLENYNYGDHWAVIEGDGEIAIVTWGSTCGPVREATRRLRAEGHAIRLVAMRLLAPAQPKKLTAALAGTKRTLIIEQSHSGQFYHYLRGHFELPEETKAYYRPGPLSMRPNEICDQILNWR
ncbi:MAG: 2-oxoacid:acceptor oxidoreductase subunit alpha, partial [Gammaproteobacteria bacterium]|nr:2-oxoacid:acceptor oxidoreductase subunit alpha [Gammaproteobacteria bacterium]